MRAIVAVPIFTVLALAIVLPSGARADVETRSEANKRPAFENIQHLINKLEQYASGRSSDEPTIKELREAVRDYAATWSEEYRLKMIKRSPIVHLVCDFVLSPLEKLTGLLDSDTSARANYVDRLTRSYRKFRPAYMGQRISKKLAESKHIDTLIKILLGITKKKLTAEHLLSAKYELAAFDARLIEMGVYEDPYSIELELEETLNFLNRDEVKALREAVMPHVHDDYVDDESSLADLKQAYKDNLFARGYSIKNNKLVHRPAKHSH